jgi:TfuA protein
MTASPGDSAGIAIFAGPSLVGSPFAGLLREKIHPPLRAGDLTEVAHTLPPGSRLLILDGEFGQSQAVTPTEIREISHSGFRVYGASSMGALRAVECSAAGMVGLGRVYTSYATGRIVADDEVALTYHPETYEPFTVPLVNIRQYLDLLGGFGASSGERFQILQQARAIHFRERSFPTLEKIVVQALRRDLEGAARGLLEQPARRLWDIKLADAERAITAVLSGSAPPPDTTLTPVPHDPTRLLQPETDIGTSDSAGQMTPP